MLGEKKFLKSVIAIISLIFILVLINTFFRMSLPYLLSKFIDNFYSSYEKYKYINQFLIASILLFLFSLFQKYLIENLQDDWLKYRINVNKYYYAIWCITLLLNGMVDIFILGISGFLFFYNKITIGNIYLYYSYGQKIKNPMESLQQQLQYVEKLFASIKRIDRLLKENSNDFEENTRKLTISEIKTIKIKDLYFAYTDKIVLDKLSIELSKGKNIGIYGKSGDGKSTFLKILSKIIKSNKDSVFINNIDINDIDMESYIEKIIYLQNEPVIFKTSLYNNISMFNETINLKEVDKFLQNEDLYKYIENKKLTDIISDEELTILQKQIISVLRVFFEKKDLIIFDEAFSHIDTKITLDLLDKIKKFNRNSIIICVSHNLEKLSSFNKMYEIKKGKIYEKE